MTKNTFHNLSFFFLKKKDFSLASFADLDQQLRRLPAQSPSEVEIGGSSPSPRSPKSAPQETAKSEFRR